MNPQTSGLIDSGANSQGGPSLQEGQGRDRRTSYPFATGRFPSPQILSFGEQRSARVLIACGALSSNTPFRLLDSVSGPRFRSQCGS